MGGPAVTLTPPEAPDPFRVSRRSVTWGLVALLLLAALVVALMAPLPYVVMKPGPTTNILGSITKGDTSTPVLAVKGRSTSPTTGQLMFTTVLVSGGPGRSVSAIDLLAAWLSPAQEVLPEEQVFPPGQTKEQADEEGAAEMASSQEVAATVALRGLGTVVPEIVRVASVPEQSPNAGILEEGDEFVSVRGVAVTGADDLRAQIQRTPPGEPLPLVVRRKGTEQALTVTTTESKGRTVIGVFLGIDYDPPIDVTINAGGVGGPSAGLMFALAIDDVLTPGPATGGQTIAGTGTLDGDGSVGPIGGIRQKMVGAQEDGATWFLAPADNCGEVSGAVPDGLRVVKVATFAEGKAALQAIASGTGQSLPSCG